MDYTSTAFLDEVPTPASSSDQTASPVLSLKQEVSGVGCNGDTFITATAGGGGPATGTRKRKSEMAMDMNIPETFPHLQRIWILPLVLSS
jgi:hypothetical protein